MEERRPKKSGKKYLFLLIVIALTWGGLMTFRTGAAPTIGIEPGLPGIGKRTPVTVSFADAGRGLTRLRVEFVQGERVEVLAAAEHQPRDPWKFWGPVVRTDEITVEVGSETL